MLELGDKRRSTSGRRDSSHSNIQPTPTPGLTMLLLPLLLLSTSVLSSPLAAQEEEEDVSSLAAEHR